MSFYTCFENITIIMMAIRNLYEMREMYKEWKQPNQQNIPNEFLKTE